MKKYGAYTEEISAMIRQRLLEEITDLLECYGTEKLNDLTRDELIAILDRMDGMRVFAKAIIEELSRDE